MAASDSLWNEAVERWSRVAELGMEAALREAGCSRQSIVRTLAKVEESERFEVNWSDSLFDIELGRCALLATFGRGVPDQKLPFDVRDRTMSDDEFAALCVNLSSNSNISNLQFSGLILFDIVKGFALLGHALASNSHLDLLCLSDFGIGTDALRCLMNGLHSNSTLRFLVLDGNPLGDEGISSVAQFLSNNKTLRLLDLDRTGCSLEGAKHMSLALGRNTTLQILYFNCFGSEGMKTLLKPFSLNIGEDAILDCKSHKNTSLHTLHLNADREHLESVTHMMRTNKSLRTLRLTCKTSKEDSHWTPFFPTDWKEHIFPALEENDTLETLWLDRFEGEEAYEALMDLVQNRNTGLKKIEISNSVFESREGQVNEELRVSRDYRSRLRGKPQTTTTSGRIVLCGYGYAGKTEICKTIKRIQHGTSFSHPFQMGWKKLMQTYPSLQKLLLGRDAHKELTARTRGFEVLAVNKGPLKSIWDFAGQQEYYALHDYVFPDFKNSYFLYICSCRLPPEPAALKGRLKDEGCVKNEFEFWLRFLASNSKQVGPSHARRLPQIRFVLTKTDTLNRREKEQIVSQCRHVVQESKGVFKDVIDVWETVEVVNAFSSEDVQCLLTPSMENLTQILSQQMEYDVCDQVRNLLERWSKINPLKPVLSLEKFYSLCREQLEFDQLPEAGWQIVLAYLNDLGETIFSEGIDFIVTNPSWFGIDVLGSLINAFQEASHLQQHMKECSCTCDGKMQFHLLYHRQGFVDRQDIIEHLECSLQSMDLKESIPAEKLVELMIHLEMCFENEDEAENSSLFMPALFDDETESAARGMRQLNWKLIRRGHLQCYGRRLECKDRYTTFLTPGFFPRLQVHLHNYIHTKGWVQNLGFEVGRNLMCFSTNGIEVCLEYAGDTDDFLDILVRSSQSFLPTLKVIRDVIQIIRIFCASPRGCQGVELIESVIRPSCVMGLHLCINRKAHSVLVSKLEEELMKDRGYTHTWSARLEDASDTDMAVDLLEGEGSHKRIMGDHEGGLLPESSSNTDELPKFFFPSIEDVGILRRLETSVNFTKKIPIKLHLLCDHKDGSHKVDGQPGRTMKLNAKAAGGYDVPLVKLAITLLWAGVGTGARVLGAGFSLPQVDSWIESLFNVPEMPLNGEMLHQIMNSGSPLKPVTEKEILKALDRYLKVDPHTLGLKEILKLQDGTSFFNDFQLRKVVYIEEDQKNRIGWVCERHFLEGFRQGILHSVPH